MGHQRIKELVAIIGPALRELSGEMLEPDKLAFGEIRETFEALEKDTARIGTINAAFAWAAENADAGRLDGSSHTLDYLMAHLGLSYREAQQRLDLGSMLFEKIRTKPLPTDDEESSEPGVGSTEGDSSNDSATEQDAGDETSDENTAEAERKRRQAELEAEAEAKRKAEEERQARQKKENEARKKAAKKAAQSSISAATLELIKKELDNLNTHANPGRGELLERAMEEATRRGAQDLRNWLRSQVNDANRNGEKDGNAAYDKRKFWLGKPDPDRGRFLGGYLDAPISAAVIKAIDVAMKADTAKRERQFPGYVERRTLEKRRADALMLIVSHYLDTRSQESNNGVGSLLISVTAEEVEKMTGSDLFLSNTGDMLSPIDLLRLGLAKHDIGVLHDENGQSLALGRTSRTASLWQKLALIAQEGVCTCGQCSTAAVWCDIHHIIPWIKDGDTDIGNLTLQCRRHHSRNNDLRKEGRNQGHMDTDKKTGRAGYRPDVGKPMEFNETEAHHQCAGAKIRSRHPKPDDSDTGVSDRPDKPDKPDNGTSAPTPPPRPCDSRGGSGSTAPSPDRGGTDGPQEQLF